MNAHSPRRLFRHRKLITAIIASLLPLAAAVGVAPGAARPRAQVKSPVVLIGAGDMDLCAAPAPPKNVLERLLCLRGRVRALTEEHRMARAEGGRVVEGDIYSITRWSFDTRENQTLVEISDSPGPAGVFSRRVVHSFDAQGRMTGSNAYAAGTDAPKNVIVYSYDERGNRVKIDSSRTEPDAHIVQEFSYDAEGREVGGSFSRLTAGGWETQTHKTAVTVEGKTTHSRTYSPDGRLRGRVSILKDDRGNTLSEELYRVDAHGEEQLLRKVTSRYDRRGFLTEVVYHKAEEWLGARAVYEYDERGNVTSLKRYRADGSFAAGGHREYEYDAAENWMKRVTSHWLSENGPAQPYRVERRQITYY